MEVSSSKPDIKNRKDNIPTSYNKDNLAIVDLHHKLDEGLQAIYRGQLKSAKDVFREIERKYGITE